ncbi:MAG: hypothetical protein ABIS35_01425 [Terracoccus sp.]
MAFASTFCVAASTNAHPFDAAHSTVRGQGVILAGGFEWGSTGRH